MIKLAATVTAAAALLALSGCAEGPAQAPAAPPAVPAPAAPAVAPAPVLEQVPAAEEQAQGLTCELDQDAKTDANGMITNRACGDHPTGATGGTDTTPQVDDAPPFVSGGNTDAPASEGVPGVPSYDPSQQTPQEYADQTLTQLCADEAYASYEPCAAYR